MERYESLAREFFQAMDAAAPSGPPGGRTSETLRGEAAVMRLLDRRGESLTPGEVCRALGMTSSRMAAVLKGLERKGLALRERDERDRRRIRVTLTAQGRALCARKQRYAQEELARLFSALGEEDAALFVRLTRRVTELLPQRPCRGRRARREEARPEAEQADEGLIDGPRAGTAAREKGDDRT